MATKSTSTMRVLYNDFPALERIVRRNAADGVERSARAVAASAKRRTPPRVASGAMRDGWRVEEVGDLERAVTNTQPYHVFQELGTATIAPHPMLIPAAAEERPHLVDELRRVFELRHELG